MKKKIANIINKNSKKRGTNTCMFVLLFIIFSAMLTACAIDENIEQVNYDEEVSVVNNIEGSEKILDNEEDISEQKVERITKESSTLLEKKSEDVQNIEELIRNFLKAYFEGNSDNLKQYLATSFEGDIAVYYNIDATDDVYINALKGLEDVTEKNVNESCVVYLEYKESEEDDTYKYLTMELIKEEAGWKIQFYGVEG